MNSKHACKYLESLQQQPKQYRDKICHTVIVSLFVLLLNHLRFAAILFKNMFCIIYFGHVFSHPPTPPDPSQLSAH